MLEENVQELIEHVQLLMKPSQECGEARSAKSSADGRRPKERHDEYYEFWRDGLDRRTSTTQSKSTTLKCSNDVSKEP